MKHSGKARRAALKMLLLTLVLTLLVPVVGFLAAVIGVSAVASSIVLLGLWCAFALFVVYFFRDPDPRVPQGANLVVSPAHGKVDVVDTVEEPRFMQGPCQRVSIFLSVLDVHVQNAPVAGKIAYYRYAEGQFLNAIRTESAVHNENVLIGIEAAEPRGARVGVRLIAGVLARRIVPWIALGDEMARGERIGLIQFGSRVDLYLPASARIRAQPGDRVVGGQTVLAVFE
jgi:phosphatidylserine decarboxylase